MFYLNTALLLFCCLFAPSVAQAKSDLPVIHLLPPQNVTLAYEGGKLNLKWDAAAAADCYQISIYKDDSGYRKLVGDLFTEKTRYNVASVVVFNCPGTFYMDVQAKSYGNYGDSSPSGISPTTFGVVGFPVDPLVGDWTGYTNDTSHKGSDYAALDFNLPDNQDSGQNVYAAADGVVEAFYPVDGQLILRHTTPLITRNGKIFGTWYTTYAHMDPVIIKEGTVKRGDLIGKISEKGIKWGLATGDHLHFSISTMRYSLENDTSISPYWLFGSWDNPNLYNSGDGVHQEKIINNMP